MLQISLKPSLSLPGLKIPCELTGVHTLKIKETDRLVAIQNEVKDWGLMLKLPITVFPKSPNVLNSMVHIATYNDHRMAMAFAPLALRTDLYIEDAEVVSKSINFWKDLETLGVEINK